MQELIAPTEDTTFNVELAIDNQIGAQPLPFPGMDKSGATVCKFFMSAVCPKGLSCPFRHVRGDKTVVCKHWLRGLCKKGDDCEFLHEYDLTKMPECFFYSKFNACSNRECPFLHIDPASKVKDCPWYDRGFCRHGPNCKNRHVKRVMCLNYLCGFCPDGPKCKKAHARFEVPTADQLNALKRGTVVCHHCGEPGHKIYSCPGMTAEEKQKLIDQQKEKWSYYSREEEEKIQQPPLPAHPKTEYVRRPLEEVTCYKCGEKGHFANRCPKGHLAFLSAALHNQPHLQNTSKEPQNAEQ